MNLARRTQLVVFALFIQSEPDTTRRRTRGDARTVPFQCSVREYAAIVYGMISFYEFVKIWRWMCQWTERRQLWAFKYIVFVNREGR
jgi:hypothetical protein